ncbi:hypothetical protein CDD83_4968 [Cordyceps sp. RAO-2017]|nr:hypothetical protein CDD83_4968 [Cordyceps sp. RAO-2017]
MRRDTLLRLTGALRLVSAAHVFPRNETSQGLRYEVNSVTSQEYQSPVPGCTKCCTSTLLTTIIRETIHDTTTVTVTEHDVSTKLEHTTDYVTTTTTSTYETSYPVTVTSIVK